MLRIGGWDGGTGFIGVLVVRVCEGVWAGGGRVAYAW